MLTDPSTPKPSTIASPTGHYGHLPVLQTRIWTVGSTQPITSGGPNGTQRDWHLPPSHARTLRPEKAFMSQADQSSRPVTSTRHNVEPHTESIHRVNTQKSHHVAWDSSTFKKNTKYIISIVCEPFREKTAASVRKDPIKTGTLHHPLPNSNRIANSPLPGGVNQPKGRLRSGREKKKQRKWSL
ncbi:uncharacterized protein EI97DRAFT_236579 [Westerdykella ornata]|uniref:Uncharacterized protein n=1 Tax=Westerdykella ornata TaxID=318751 RepID=A0A6A6J6T0_WESOR|nr:uncharacterized protein EI97DRAFT_236579 [Westerdykella ornata]KAF2272105.1 hypothetical protein EI97DRAFT_236579 [Westerdykella ornata]